MFNFGDIFCPTSASSKSMTLAILFVSCAFIAMGTSAQFRWSECGNRKKLVTVTGIEVRPDHIAIPVWLNISIRARINKRQLPEQGKVKVTISKLYQDQYYGIPCKLWSNSDERPLLETDPKRLYWKPDKHRIETCTSKVNFCTWLRKNQGCLEGRRTLYENFEQFVPLNSGMMEDVKGKYKMTIRIFGRKEKFQKRRQLVSCVKIWYNITKRYNHEPPSANKDFKSAPADYSPREWDY